MLSNEGIGDISEGAINRPWISSVRPANFKGQIVAVKSINKPWVSMTPSVVTEINQASFIL